MGTSRNLQRRSIRLKGYDYSQPGAYFITICTKDKIRILGNIEGERVIYSQIGKIAEECWLNIPDHFPNVKLDQWIIMPNHIHGIIFIHDSRRGEAFVEDHNQMKPPTANASPVRHPKGTTPKSLSAIIQNFKSVSTRRVNKLQVTPRKSLWQRGYYDRIIRNEMELDHIRRYIQENPLKWDLDPCHV
jgi:putative transposase